MNPRDVMLIDDDEADLFLHTLALKESGLVGEVVVMQRAQDALEYLKSQQHDLSVIFLDINMPIMDGFQFVEAYRELSPDQQARAIVVMLTSSLRPADKRRAESSGLVFDYVAKPLEADGVHAIFARLDEQARSGESR